MELWLEYMQRHGLPIVRPQEPFLEEAVGFYVPASPPVENRVWAFFLMNNSYLIANYSYELEDRINQWCDELLAIHRTNMPTINEQRNIVFGQVPYLERLWDSFQDNSYMFTSSSLTVVPNSVQVSRRQLYAPAQIHL